MKKTTLIPAFCEMSDKMYETIITEICKKRDNIGEIYTENEYGNITISSKELYDLYMDIHNIMAAAAIVPKKITIIDFGCGIGNVFELLYYFLKHDENLKHVLRSISMIGVEKVPEFANFAQKTVRSLINLKGIIIKSDINEFDTFNKVQTLLDKDSFNIFYCNRLFRLSPEQFKLEEKIIKIIPKNSILVTPMGKVTPVVEEKTNMKVYYKGNKIRLY
jgi:hypothetical protein